LKKNRAWDRTWTERNLQKIHEEKVQLSPRRQEQLQDDVRENKGSLFR